MQHLARILRGNQTDVERMLWQYLRNRQLSGRKFRRQHIINPYIVDFICFEERLIVELDGGQHMENAAADSQRTTFLQSQGFRVVRFWNNEVLANLEGVLFSIESVLLAPLTPALSRKGPARGERVLRRASRAVRVSAVPSH